MAISTAVTQNDNNTVTVSASATNDGCDFGAFTPNTTTSGIQEAATFAGTNGKIRLSGGTFGITTGITLGPNQILEGSGEKSTIIKANAATWGASVSVIAFSAAPSGARIACLEVDGNGQTLYAAIDGGNGFGDTNANNNGPVYEHLYLTGLGSASYALDMAGIEGAVCRDVWSTGANNGLIWMRHQGGAQSAFNSGCKQWKLDGTDIKLYACYSGQGFIVTTALGNNSTIRTYACWVDGSSSTTTIVYNSSHSIRWFDYGSVFQISNSGTTFLSTTGGTPAWSSSVFSFYGTVFYNTGGSTTFPLHPSGSNGQATFLDVMLRGGTSWTAFIVNTVAYSGTVNLMTTSGLATTGSTPNTVGSYSSGGGQTASLTNVINYTPPSQNGKYRVSLVISNGSGTNTGTTAATVGYASFNAGAVTATVPLTTSNSASLSTSATGISTDFIGIYYFWISNAGTAITVSTTVTGTVHYAFSASLEFLGVT